MVMFTTAFGYQSKIDLSLARLVIRDNQRAAPTDRLPPIRSMFFLKLFTCWVRKKNWQNMCIKYLKKLHIKFINLHCMNYYFLLFIALKIPVYQCIKVQQVCKKKTKIANSGPKFEENFDTLHCSFNIVMLYFVVIKNLRYLFQLFLFRQ